jgi:hypothetical protein
VDRCKPLTRGLLALLAGEADRRAGWDEAVVYVDAAGRASDWLHTAAAWPHAACLPLP